MKWPRRRKSLGCSVTFEGVGVHAGTRVKICLEPSREGSGLRFVREDLNPSPEWLVRPGQLPSADASRRMTALVSEQGHLDTVEHLLAALWCLGISDAVIRIQGPELPILDGSALEFITALRREGELREGEEREVIRLTEPVFVSDPLRAILALPDDHLSVAYTLDMPYPGLKQTSVSYDALTREFETEIAPARTFCPLEDAERLKAAGFGLGATTQNTLVIGPEGPLQNTLRFPDECARHKVLDLIGDLALLGGDLAARIVAVRSGHELHQRLAREVYESLSSAKERV